MGGCGSGRHRGARKRRVESCVALDVNELRRKGALVPGATGTLTWERDGNSVASANFRADTAALILCYDAPGIDAPKVIEQAVALSFVPARFGGERAYFLCPVRNADGASRCSISQGEHSADTVWDWPTQANVRTPRGGHGDAQTSAARD